MVSKSKSSRAGYWFGGGLLAIALLIFYFTGGKFISMYVQTATWSTTQGQLHTLDLKYYSGETTTSKVIGEYSFRVFGQEYRSSQISIYSGSDNIGDYWQDLYRDLSRQKARGAITVLYNPNDPNQSVLDRTFRWSKLAFALLFVLIFGGFGAWILYASLAGKPNPKNTLSSDKPAYIMLFWFGSVFFFMGAFISVLGLPSELKKGNYAALLMLIFPIVGAGFMVYALKLRRAYRLYGKTPLELDPTSPQVGGQLGGRVLITKGLARFDHRINYKAVLTCSETRSNRDESRSSIAWQSEAPVVIRRAGRGLQASFLFDLPGTVFASNETHKSKHRSWDISIEPLGKASSSSPAFKRSWPVEVFPANGATKAESSIRIADSIRAEFEKQQNEIADESALKQIPYVDDGRYIHLLSSARRVLLSSLAGITFGAVFAGMGYFTVNDGWWPGYFFLFIGAATVIASVYALGSSIDVKIDKAARIIHSRHYWFGLQTSSHDIALFNERQFSLKKTFSTEQGSKRTTYYKMLVNNNGKKIPLANHIVGKEAAKALRQALVDMLF